MSKFSNSLCEDIDKFKEMWREEDPNIIIIIKRGTCKGEVFEPNHKEGNAEVRTSD